VLVEREHRLASLVASASHEGRYARDT